MLEVLVCFLLLVGGVFLFVGSLGLVRLPDFYTRLHAPTKATTLGIGSVLIASMVFMSEQQKQLSVHELMITLFLFMTAPIAAHMMAKAALHLRVKADASTQNQPFIDYARQQRSRSDES
ncbi:MAG: Na+/H+ antiporter subunit G [Hahellaceae bacterium]|nr:Na+/H+ antiporter subunit G [Hahellaceae bacterium]